MRSIKSLLRLRRNKKKTRRVEYVFKDKVFRRDRKALLPVVGSYFIVYELPRGVYIVSKVTYNDTTAEVIIR